MEFVTINYYFYLTLHKYPRKPLYPALSIFRWTIDEALEIEDGDNISKQLGQTTEFAINAEDD
jgi:hypothetical protein